MAKYYLTTKEPLPLDIDFLVQDTYAAIRPQWKLVTELDEAARLFAEAITANYTGPTIEKTLEIEDDGILSESSEELEPDSVPEPQDPDGRSSTDEAEVRPILTLGDGQLKMKTNRRSQTATLVYQALCQRKRSLSQDKKKSVTQKPKQTLTGNLKR